MVSDDRIRAELANTLEKVDFDGVPDFEHGKVRDWLKLDDKRIIVVSDRISAFDRILGTIPFKGQVLNQIAAFWFEQTKQVVPNHVIDVPDPNVMLVHDCEQLNLEFVIRGYITGVTKTSAWYNYEMGVRDFCGNKLPDGLVKNQKLAKPILTPTTKHEKHDRNVSREEAIAEGLIDAETFDQAADLCFKLYDAASKFAATRGLIFVDTKYEIGRLNGKLVVSDEVNTPDSSRYWYADTYDDLMAKGEEQRKLDKEYVREWLAAKGFRGDGDIPLLSDDVRIEAAKRYIKAYELVTGKEFIVSEQPVQERVAAALKKLC